ncbi:MAG TPA: PLP-dependent aminotransferase family protein [Blastocatellia bacterium]|nr:PLP-dependent aminotransferase family protein [Blastocatellia bacterium]
MAVQETAVQAVSPARAQFEASPQPGFHFANRMSRMPVSAIRELLKVTEHPEIISFAGGLPAPELFPVDAIARAHAEVFADEAAVALQYSTTEGCRSLRQWIASRMQMRGITTTADHVMITTGAQQGVDLTAKIFLERGDTVIVENPCYLAAIQSFSGYEASFIPIDSDDHGMRVDDIEEALKHSRPRLIYIVSEFSNPKGTTLSHERRMKLIELSARHRIPILEDNPYSELRYQGNRPPPLAALDTEGLVIHLGSFSKTLSPGMRLGWLIASDAVFQNAVIAKQAADLHTSTVEQRAAARLLQTFDYDRHIRDLCTVYGERCQAMRSAIERYFPQDVKATEPEGGLFIWVQLPERINAEELFIDAVAERVAFVPGTSFFACEPRQNFMRLNFSNQTPEMIEEGIKRIGSVLKRRLA